MYILFIFHPRIIITTHTCKNNHKTTVNIPHRHENTQKYIHSVTCKAVSRVEREKNRFSSICSFGKYKCATLCFPRSLIPRTRKDELDRTFSPCVWSTDTRTEPHHGVVVQFHAHGGKSWTGTPVHPPGRRSLQPELQTCTD